MDIVLLPQHWSAILAICIMIGAIAIIYLKKMMATQILIITNVIIFVITLIYYRETIYGLSESNFLYAGLGFRASYLTPENIPQTYTLFTCMFTHGGFMHLFGNMFVFLFVGSAFEQRIGAKNFLIIYFLTGICGALTFAVLNIGSTVPLIGASGALFGIMGAFAFSFPRDEVLMPIPVGIMLIRRIKVMYAVILFAVIETVIVIYETQAGIQSGTAHFAHFGGLISGGILGYIVIRKRKTHSKEGKTIYYDSYAANKPRKIDFSKLESLATTPELRNILEKIRNEDIPHAREIWIEHFVEKARCPKCQSSLIHFDGKISCENCGFKTRY